VTGPTGSGKTTTLYAALRERLVQSLSICTVEDPVEYDLPGVTQVQTNEAQGLGFPEVLRAFMRQNPDIIFVGEMRDPVTAKMACNAALTGHMVLSSLHTNDALSTLARLKSLGVEPFVIASSLLGVVNQRLVRRICPACRAEAPASDATLRTLRNVGIVLDASVKLYRGKKCKLCNGEGFKGRVGVYELLVVTQKIKDAISRDADIVEIRNAAMDGSYVSLARYATFLLTQGLTEPGELLRILPREQA
jgi:type IV pilus assembly protein PilB